MSYDTYMVTRNLFRYTIKCSGAFHMSTFLFSSAGLLQSVQNLIVDKKEVLNHNNVQVALTPCLEQQQHLLRSTLTLQSTKMGHYKQWTRRLGPKDPGTHSPRPDDMTSTKLYTFAILLFERLTASRIRPASYQVSFKSEQGKCTTVELHETNHLIQFAARVVSDQLYELLQLLQQAKTAKTWRCTCVFSRALIPFLYDQQTRTITLGWSYFYCAIFGFPVCLSVLSVRLCASVCNLMSSPWSP